MYILKRQSLGGFKNLKDSSKDKELEYLRKIDQGSITDAEIKQVVKDGGKPLEFMQHRANRLQKDLSHWDRKYGKGVFDGVDNNGAPFKDHQAGSVKNTEFNKEHSKLVKANLEPL